MPVSYNAVANQAAYQAPEVAQATNTFTPANIQQANDMGSAATNWSRKFLEDLARASANTKDPDTIAKTMYSYGYNPEDLVGYI